MKRRIALLFAAASIVSAVGVFAPTPATAVPTGEACAGTGRATLSTGLGLPGVHAKNSAAFAFTLATGTCTTKSSLSATGTVTGWCGQSEGKGVTNNGRFFTFTSAGGTLVVTGELQGQVTAVADPTVANNSCTNKTATNFIVNGAVTKHTCPVVRVTTKGKAGTTAQTNATVCV
jgi:hypothetical protein